MICDPLSNLRYALKGTPHWCLFQMLADQLPSRMGFQGRRTRTDPMHEDNRRRASRSLSGFVGRHQNRQCPMLGAGFAKVLKPYNSQ